MKHASVQAPRAVVMIRPHRFSPNADTARDNAFQSVDVTRAPDAIAAAAYREVSAAARRLEDAGVTVRLFEDEGDNTPDSVFPNNWFSTHAGGHVAIFPMFAPSRRRERRYDIIEMLKRSFRVQDIVDYSGLEEDGVYLEGTGAMVLDHGERIAYAARSQRCNEVALERFCADFGYEPMAFDAHDAQGRPIYHTNVLMHIGTEICLVGVEAIGDDARRRQVRARLEAGGREIIALSQGQIADFAGNAMELQGRDGRLIALSARAWGALTPGQRAAVERACTPLLFEIPTIELAGGSVRCMLAAVHLTARGDHGPAIPETRG